MHRRRSTGSPLSRSYQAGFTIIELMVTIGIIVLLIGLLFPVIGKVRRAAYNTDSLNFISVLQNAITRYHQDFNAFPGPFSNADVFYGTTAPYSPGAAGQTDVPGRYGLVTPLFKEFDFHDSAADNGGTQVYHGGQDKETDIWDGQAFKVTMAENLVLGLLGGLKVDFKTNPPTLDYDPSTIGQGPARLSNLPNVPHTRSPAYMQVSHLSWRKDDTDGLLTGQFKDDAASATDSIIPEFVDSFPGAMPILYLRARRGVVGLDPGAAAYSNQNNPVITDSRGMGAAPYRAGAYDLSQVLPYTIPDANGNSIGENKRISPSDYAKNMGSPKDSITAPKNSPTPQHGLQTVTVNSTLVNPPAAGQYFQYPYDAYAYFLDPGQPGVAGSGGTPGTPAAARQKDGYILISAGIDRVYGTSDDLTSFGDVAP